MNLRELNGGTISTKPWFTPVCASLSCQDITCENINGVAPLGKVFTATANATVGNSLIEDDFSPSGVGSLNVPANSFSVGDTITFKLEGLMSVLAGTSLSLILRTNTNILASLVVVSPDATGKGFALEFKGVVRSIGTFGVALIQITDSYFQSVNVGLSPIAVISTAFNGTNFSTTIDNDFTVSALWSIASVGNTITAFNFDVHRS